MQKNELSFEAVVFDMDGVITQTAMTHAAAWKEMFDEYLKKREAEYGEVFREFTHGADYLPFVDGKPRYSGVASFLESRGIDIPLGVPSDPPGTETCCGLGNRKNEVLNEVLKRDGVKIYASTIQLILQLREAGIKLGVASSSKNCKQILEAVGLLDLFDARVDGEVSAGLGLQGKPEPDIFITASDILKVPYNKAIIVEDAVSGVQAGSRGHFGLTLGIAREDNARELLDNGADYVVGDLEEVNGIRGLNKIFLQIGQSRDL